MKTRLLITSIKFSIMTSPIQDYLNSLPEDIDVINISCKSLTCIQSLKRFYNLRHLDCSHNRLTTLPELNHSLVILKCSHNELTNLPALNHLLEDLDCSHNQLTRLPELNHLLEELDCSHNQLTRLPELNHSLHLLTFQTPIIYRQFYK
jgi:Leucine-rich repeat (LRR) protein